MKIDTAALRVKIFERTGQKLSADDPIFAAAVLNDLLLEETAKRIGIYEGSLVQQNIALKQSVNQIQVTADMLVDKLDNSAVLPWWKLAIACIASSLITSVIFLIAFR